MDDMAAEVARRAATRLAADGDPQLPEEVERHLRAGPAAPDTYLDPATAISLGSLIVSAASLAWTIYRDLRSQGTAKPSREVVSRKVRLEIAERAPNVETADRDRVIEVTVQELVSLHDNDS